VTAEATVAAVATERWDGLLRGASLATLDGDAGYGAIHDGALAWRDGRIAWVGARGDLPADAEQRSAEIVDLHGGWITPGLIDCHTHLVFAGDRAAEFEQRLQGASYEEIARALAMPIGSIGPTRGRALERLRRGLERSEGAYDLAA
jgi:imidazolonepropionase